MFVLAGVVTGILLLITIILLHCPDKLQIKLRGEGGIKALLGMVRCGHPDVLAQVARGIANFAKCESRASTQGKQLRWRPFWGFCCGFKHNLLTT